jgi:hypothetical protein
MSGESAADTVQRAARATLAAGSARVRTVTSRRFDPEEVALGSEGVIDLERGRARLESRSDLIDSLFEDDEEEDDDGPYVVYVDGTTTIQGVEGLWSRDDDRTHGHDPVLLLRLLAEHPLEDAVRDGEDEVRGARCATYAGRLDSRILAAALGAPRLPAPGWRSHVRAWIDPDGRVRRASWRPARVGRPRSPSRPRGAPLWHTLELWDFGLPVAIDLPTDVRTPTDERMDLATHLLVAQAVGQLGVRGARMWRKRRRARQRG